MSEPPKIKPVPTGAQDPIVGTIVAERYRIKRLIARGGMGVVYLAEHIQLNRQVALKILRPPIDAEDPASFEERFELEAQTLAQLDHPNIVTLHDFGETEDGRYYLAMEYVGGPRISQILRKGPMVPTRIMALTEQVCQAIAYSHRKDVVHRDLKPSNLLIRIMEDGSEQVKVVDFGLVKLLSTDQSITRAGLIVGSPHCMAPEQVRGHDVDVRTDLYAIGVMLFRGVTGQYPIHGSSPSATMIAQINEAIPAMSDVNPDLELPPGFERMVRRCLEKQAIHRYQSAEDLIKDLHLCMAIPVEQYQLVTEFDTTIHNATLNIPKTSTSIVVAAVGTAVLFGSFLVLMISLLLWVWQPWNMDGTALPNPSPETSNGKETLNPSTLSAETPETALEKVKTPTTDTVDSSKNKPIEMKQNRKHRLKPKESNPKETSIKDVAKEATDSKEAVNGTNDHPVIAKEAIKNDAVKKSDPNEKESDKGKETPEGYLGLPDFD